MHRIVLGTAEEEESLEAPAPAGEDAGCCCCDDMLDKVRRGRGPGPGAVSGTLSNSDDVAAV